MKCISLWQPWATLVALGEKKIETRSWSTQIKGTIAIHAAKKWNKELHSICFNNPFAKTLLNRGYRITTLAKEFDFGAIIAVVHLERCERINAENIPKGSEFCFGDYTIGRFMWHFDDATIIEPIPYKGRQGLFDIPDTLFNNEKDGA